MINLVGTYKQTIKMLWSDLYDYCDAFFVVIEINAVNENNNKDRRIEN